ncbi:MAG TPA: HAMP domain-containing sensor histidine kinase [Candidatus Limnocylindrales bacterium]|nr:HAMP domain-containing sensor histidine kinase [Candidatus Limnocylindrales bacterium]
MAAEQAGPRAVVASNGLTNPAVTTYLSAGREQRLLADSLAQATVTIRFGRGTAASFVPSANGLIVAPLQARPAPGQTQESLKTEPVYFQADLFFPFVVEVTLSDPYTFRATAVSNVAGLLGAIALFALALAVIVAAGLARRFTTPLRRLTDATRGLAEGDLSRRVAPTQLHGGSSELSALGLQFNTMAERLEESVTIIRRDRDRSRDFLADVSHELRTPIAALRTFNELLREQAADDPDARAEFLESSGQQIERLDWLAQNLLDLSKLDSGLVMLDLRPDDLRAAVESAVEQARAAARRRGVELTVDVPDRPLRIRHDPLRIGQVVTNLVGNAIKFTPPRGSVVVGVRASDSGAEIDVTDTGVGIDAAELPRIFERFYRGSRANEARGSGSGLGLAIVRSIVEMHSGTVVVESRLGAGTRFVVTLPRDPRAEDAPAPPATEPPPGHAEAAAGDRIAATARQTLPAGKVADSSPRDSSQLNPEASP